MTDRDLNNTISRVSSSSLSSSPGRLGSNSRPQWPWDQSGSVTPQSSWQSRGSALANVSTQSRPSSMRSTVAAPAQTSTRQWSFTGFEWFIRDVHKLRDYIEGVQTGNDDSVSADPPVSPKYDDFEVLKESPTLGDKFKLEIARSPAEEGDEISPTLSLYITSLMMDFAHPHYETSASISAAIKCQGDRVGERGAQPSWIWEHPQEEFTFRVENEVWVCPFPALSKLLETPRIRDTDSLVVYVQIHSPVGSFLPPHWQTPRNLLNAFEASLDNVNTGDVQFICLERRDDDGLDLPSPRSSSSASTQSQETIARKRIIYAHSDILIHRSEYFATLLNSDFSESITTKGDRKQFSIVVEEADFVTIYWLLKFCYANWLLLADVDDPRTAIEGVGTGWSTKWLGNRGGERSGEWDWKTLRKTGGESRESKSVTSVDSLHSPTTSSNPQGAPLPTSASRAPTTSRSAAPVAKSSMHPPSSSQSHLSTSPNARRPHGVASNSTPTSLAPHARTKPIVIPLSLNSTSHVPSSAHSPHGQRQPDPHPHPVPAPRPASALSMYQVAHRYSMPALASLCLEHMMTTITPETSFALLLASACWEELRLLVEDYVVDKWDEVSASEEFEQCCEEVARGEWGSDGGRSLMAVFRRLRSPSSR